jgi:hypothetical protein
LRKVVGLDQLQPDVAGCLHHRPAGGQRPDDYHHAPDRGALRRSSQEELDDVVNDLIFAVQEVADRRLGIATGSTNKGVPAPEEAHGTAAMGGARRKR